MRVHTLRGRVEANTKKRLILDDGRTTHGMIVKEFYIWAKDGIDDPRCVLALSEDNIGTDMDASNSNQIAWSHVAQSAANSDRYSIIDPDHIVIRDLFISNLTSVDSNYLVILEAKNISEEEAILQLIKEGQQNV